MRSNPPVLVVCLSGIAAVVGGALHAIDYGYLWISLNQVLKVEVAASPSTAQDEKAEFDRICGQVQIATTLEVEKLRQLIEDCDTLTRTLRQSENPQAKIWIQRLTMCRQFFEYAVELLQSEENSD